MEQKRMILDGTLAAFNRKGIKFTMDDVAREAGMSKKTLYAVFSDKKALILAMVDDIFDAIKVSEAAVLADDTLSTEEKIRRILGVMPTCYSNVDLAQLFQLKDKYPQIYRQVEARLENGWEATISLLEQGMEEGCIRRVSVPILKMMMEASLEQFFQRDILKRNGLTYQQALQEVVAVLVDGIVIK